MKLKISELNKGDRFAAEFCDPKTDEVILTVTGIVADNPCHMGRVLVQLDSAPDLSTMDRDLIVTRGNKWLDRQK